MASREQEIAIKIAAELEKSFGKNINEVNCKLAKMGSVAKNASKIVGTSFAAVKIKDFVSEAASTYSSFEQAMAQTAATAGASEADYKAMEKAALEAGKSTTKTADEAANALGYMSLAGWDTNQSIAGLMPILRASEAYQSDLAETSDTVTDSLSALGLSVDDLGHYLDVATTANNKSNQTAMQMMQAFIGCGLTLDDLGDSIENVSGLYGMLANRGTKASEAGTAMKAIVLNTKKNAKVLEELGVEVYDKTTGQYKGISNVLQQYNEKTKNMTQEQRDAISLQIAGKNHLGSFNKIMEGFNTTLADGTTEWEKLQKELNNSNGALDNMANRVTGTLQGAWSRFNSAIDDVKINMIKNFAPYATAAINKLSEEIPKATTKIMDLFERIKSGSGVFGEIRQIALNTFMNIKAKIEENQPTLDKLIQVAGDLKQKLFDAFNHAKPTLIYLIEQGIPFVVDKLFELLGAATDVYNFINNNWTKIGPIAKGIGAAILSIKMYKFAKGVMAATKALTLLRITQIKDKAETIILQALYAKDAIVRAVSTAAVWAQNAALTTYNVVAGIATTVTTALGAAFTFLTSPITLIILAIAAIIAIGVLLYKNWDKVKEVAANVWNGICTFFTSAKERICGVLDNLATKFPGAFTFISNCFNNWKQGVLGVIDGVKQIFSGLIDFVTGIFTGNWSKAWQGVVNVFGGIFKTIESIAKVPINAVIDMVNFVISKINGISVDVPEGVPGIGGQTFGVHIDPINHLATGGIATKSTIAEIGEGKEPEAVLPLSKLASLINGYIHLEKENSVKNALQGLEDNDTTSASQIIYSPVNNFYGEAPSKKDLVEAGRISQAEFNKMLDKYFKDKKRVSFG